MGEAGQTVEAADAAVPGMGRARGGRRLVLSGLAMLALVLAGVMGYVAWTRRPPAALEFEAWEPSTAQIVAAVESLGEAATDAERSDVFERLFTSRFRKHVMAVRLKRRSAREVDLLCAAAVPKSDMARMAFLAYADGYVVLGYPLRVHIYETYILAPRRRVGILEPVEAGGRPTVRFDLYGLAEGGWRERLQRDGVIPPDKEAPSPAAMDAAPGASGLSRSAGSPAARPSR
ncbi:MAG: hypothetical protein NT029_17445 [Armatimonadetes bacterium]|nr:hypothetical protein [Armatimonadota bacterium]